MKKLKEFLKIKISTVLYVLFSAVFAVGVFISGREIVGKISSDNAYVKIRSQIQEANMKKSISESALAAKIENDSNIEENRLYTMDFTEIKKINSEVVAWIKLDGTYVDYPILQTDNNDYYLHYMYNGKKNKAGSIFIDYRNKSDFSDMNTVIYGHNMRADSMFTIFEEYKQQDFYTANPQITIYTPNGDYSVELICGTIEDGEDEFVQFNFENDRELQEYVNYFKKRSTFQSNAELQDGDRIVSFCTCSFEYTNARYMLIGRLVPR